MEQQTKVPIGIMNPNHPKWDEFLQVLETRLDMESLLAQHGRRYARDFGDCGSKGHPRAMPMTRARLAEVGLSESEIDNAVEWFRHAGANCDCGLVLGDLQIEYADLMYRDVALGPNDFLLPSRRGGPLSRCEVARLIHKIERCRKNGIQPSWATQKKVHEILWGPEAKPLPITQNKTPTRRGAGARKGTAWVN